MSGDQLDPDAIEARLGNARRMPPGFKVRGDLYVTDVAALLTEARRLWKLEAEVIAERAERAAQESDWQRLRGYVE